jgi:hypothetical protein
MATGFKTICGHSIWPAAQEWFLPSIGAVTKALVKLILKNIRESKGNFASASTGHLWRVTSRRFSATCGGAEGSRSILMVNLRTVSIQRRKGIGTASTAWKAFLKNIF